MTADAVALEARKAAQAETEPAQATDQPIAGQAIGDGDITA